MVVESQKNKRKTLLFLSSSLVNSASFIAQRFPKFRVVVVIDRNFENLNKNFRSCEIYSFNKNKLFEKNKEKYFDQLSMYCSSFSPDIIVTNNFTKLLPDSFIDYVSLTCDNVPIINIHHGDLSEMFYVGISGGFREFIELGKITTTIHYIEDKGMDTGTQLFVSRSTHLDELKREKLIDKAGLIDKKNWLLIKQYHERTKVLNPLIKVLTNLFENK